MSLAPPHHSEDPSMCLLVSPLRCQGCSWLRGDGCNMVTWLLFFPALFVSCDLPTMARSALLSLLVTLRYSMLRKLESVLLLFF